MTDARKELMQAAQRIANDIKGRSLALEPEKRRIQTRLTEIDAIGNLASLALKRAAEFVPISGVFHSCPSCWVSHAKSVTLQPRESATDADLFVCKECGFEFQTQMLG